MCTRPCTCATPLFRHLSFVPGHALLPFLTRGEDPRRPLSICPPYASLPSRNNLRWLYRSFVLDHAVVGQPKTCGSWYSTAIGQSCGNLESVPSALAHPDIPGEDTKEREAFWSPREDGPKPHQDVADIARVMLHGKNAPPEETRGENVPGGGDMENGGAATAASDDTKPIQSGSAPKKSYSKTMFQRAASVARRAGLGTLVEKDEEDVEPDER